MFLSLEFPIVISLIAVIVVQYGFAVFCLVKLAYLDLPRKTYILWNVFILLAFFVGGIVFLIYYARGGKDKRIEMNASQVIETDETADDTAETVESAESDGDNVGAEEPATHEEDTENNSDPNAE